MSKPPGAKSRPATVIVTDFYRPADLQPDAETASHACVPRELRFHVTYAGETSEWTAACPEIAGFVAQGARLGHEEIGSAILDQLAEFRDPQP